MKSTIAINIKLVRKSHGGGNQWAKMMVEFLEDYNYKVINKLAGDIDLIIMMDPRNTSPFTFGLNELRSYKLKRPEVPVLHRINECDARKDSHFMDDMLRDINALADHTVFISDWLLEYHSLRWYDPCLPHTVIRNAADSKIFNTRNKKWYSGTGKLQLVTHHWSDNWNKGFGVYKQVDEMIYKGILNEVEFHIIGRWPSSIEWKSALANKPMRGAKLANYLKSCDLYITGSKNEPCGMHHIEAAQCGLPIIYSDSGGGILEMASKYGVSFSDDIVEAVKCAASNYNKLCCDLIDNMPCSCEMLGKYGQVIQRLIMKKQLFENSILCNN